MKRKFEEEFKPWILKKYGHYYFGEEYEPEESLTKTRTPYEAFKESPESMQWGLLVDFFEEKGISITISKRKGLSYDVVIRKINCDGDWISIETATRETRQEARKEAIDISKQLYNGK